MQLDWKAFVIGSIIILGFLASIGLLILGFANENEAMTAFGGAAFTPILQNGIKWFNGKFSGD